MESNINSEISILSIIIKNNDYLVKIMDSLKPNDFYRTSHQVIYSKMIELYKNDVKFDEIVLINNLNKEIKNKVTTITEITNIANNYISSETLKSHIDLVLEASKKRKLIEMFNKVNEIESVNEKIEYIQDTLLELNTSNSDDTYKSMAEVMEETLKKIEKSYNSKDGITGIKTNLINLDNAINGLEKGSMVVIGARPSCGKTAFSLKLIENIEANVLYVQLDMTLEGMGQRILSTETKINNNLIGKGKLNDNQFLILANKSAKISKKDNLFFYSPARSTVTNILLKAKEIKAKHGLDAIIIDHIGKIAPETRGSKYEQMTVISNRIKAMARELDLCCIALCQLSRAVEQRQDKHPMLSDLRDTGAIEEDADVIGFLYREGYYKAKEEKIKITDDILELDIQKNRNGACGMLEFEYKLTTQEITPII